MPTRQRPADREERPDGQSLRPARGSANPRAEVRRTSGAVRTANGDKSISRILVELADPRKSDFPPSFCPKSVRAGAPTTLPVSLGLRYVISAWKGRSLECLRERRSMMERWAAE